MKKYLILITIVGLLQNSNTLKSEIDNREAFRIFRDCISVGVPISVVAPFAWDYYKNISNEQFKKSAKIAGAILGLKLGCDFVNIIWKKNKEPESKPLSAAPKFDAAALDALAKSKQPVPQSKKETSSALSQGTNPLIPVMILGGIITAWKFL